MPKVPRKESDDVSWLTVASQQVDIQNDCMALLLSFVDLLLVVGKNGPFHTIFSNQKNFTYDFGYLLSVIG